MSKRKFLIYIFFFFLSQVLLIASLPFTSLFVFFSLFDFSQYHRHNSRFPNVVPVTVRVLLFRFILTFSLLSLDYLLKLILLFSMLCMYKAGCTFVCISTYRYKHLSIHIYIYICMRAYTCTQVYRYQQVYIYIFRWVCLHVCTYICIYVYICLCIVTNIHEVET